MSLATRIPLTRLLGSLRISKIPVQSIQNVQTRTVLPLHLHQSKCTTNLNCCMYSTSYFGNHKDDLDSISEEIEKFGLNNFRHKYDPILLKEVCSKFISIGVSREDLIHAFCRPARMGEYSDPPVFTMNLSVLQKLLNVFLNHGIKPKALIRVVHYYGNDIKSLTPTQLDCILMKLASLPYLEISIIDFLDVCPQLILLDAEMEEKIKSLRSIFPKKELMHLLRNAPNVLTDPWQITEEKLSYIYKEMGLDQPHISYNKTMSYSIQHIRDRHEAMVRTGVYKKPNLRHDRLSHLMNEKVELIMESSDEQFSKRILKIPREDYDSFLELLHRERQEDLTGVQLDDYDSDEEEVLEEEAMRNSYGPRPKRTLANMPTTDYQRWLQNM
ncbi:hypothetical protein FHG87_001473 [Trinorchestia longiramus]|nr:hypothetical protein FHG87_001473 [Trinorchestia longiramus]